MMACNRRSNWNGANQNTNHYIPWNREGVQQPWTMEQLGGDCPFLSTGGYPMTHDEMMNMISGLRYARLALCVNGVPYVTPVCFSVRECMNHPVFTLRLRTDCTLMSHLRSANQAVLQFDRTLENGGACTVQVYGSLKLTGTTGCYAVIEVCTTGMLGECFGVGGCGCCNACSNCTTQDNAAFQNWNGWTGEEKTPCGFEK